MNMPNPDLLYQILELAQENERLKIENKFLTEPTIQSFTMRPHVGGKVESTLELRHPILPIMADALATMMEDINAPNFFTAELLSAKAGRLELTIQKVYGKPMAEIISELKKNLQLEKDHVELLAGEIAKLACEAGIYNNEVPLTGPQILQLLSDLQEWTKIRKEVSKEA